jgi:ankyrin repeat protein
MKNNQFHLRIRCLLLLFFLPFYINCASMTPLTQAAMDGNDSAIRTLLNNGAQINEPNSTNGWTPLYWAIYYQKPDTVQLLLDNGASVITAAIIHSNIYDYVI